MKSGIDPAIGRARAKLLDIGATALILLLAACGGNTKLSNTGTASSATPAALHGTVHGGQSALVGSAVAVYAVDDATPLVTTTTAGGGAFTANFTCPSSTALIYVTVQGGFPGGDGSQNNAAISLESGVGPCGSLPAFVNIDELSTVATAYALSAFHNSTGIASSGNMVGVTNAFATVPSLVDFPSGGPANTLPDASACSAGSPPANCLTVLRLDALANSVAACVNSAGPTSTECTELFNCATPGASFSGGACTTGATAATDTLHAVLDVAQNPGTVSIAGIYDVATKDVVFSPTLSAAPTDWTLSINYTDPSLDSPFGLAIDAAGDVWITNFLASSVTELGPTGAVLSPPGVGYTAGGFLSPEQIAIDANGDVWVANFHFSGGDSLIELNSSGVPQSGASGYPVSGEANRVAVDPAGHIWVAGNALTEFQGSSGTAPAPGTILGGPYSGGGLNQAVGIAIDGSGNIWLPNAADTVSEYVPGVGWENSTGFSCGASVNGAAIDQEGTVWLANDNSVSELNSAGGCVSAGYKGGGLDTAFALAIDGAGNVWVDNDYGASISEFEGASGSSPGSALSPAHTGFSGAGESYSQALAIDSSGNLWTANGGSNSVTEFIGVAAPVKTPLIGPPQSPN